MTEDIDETEGMFAELAPATSADVVPGPEHDTVRQNRTVTIHFEGSVSVEVIEPPMVFDAEIKQAINRSIMSALSSLRIGSPNKIRLQTSSSEPGPND